MLASFAEELNISVDSTRPLPREELLDADLPTKIRTDMSRRMDVITTMCVKANIKLHYQQLKNLLLFPNVIWFTNDEASVKILEDKYLELSASDD